MSNDDNNAERNKTPNPQRPEIFGSAIRNVIFFILILFIFSYFFAPDTTKEITWSEFENLLVKKNIEKVEVEDKMLAKVYITKDSLSSEDDNTFFYQQDNNPVYEMNIGSPEVFEEKLMRAQQDLPDEARVEVVYISSSGQNWIWILMFLGLPVIFFYFMIRWGRKAMGGGGSKGIFSFGKSNAKLFESNDKVGTTFKDVAGLEEAKAEMQETVSFLKNPAIYTELGAKIPKGVLLVGPPGTGKTLMAKAIAGEAKVPFFSLSGSEFVEMFVGVGASRVRDLFTKAKEKAPCIIFIDELDAIGRERGKNNNLGGANDERESTLNQLLTEMDGFNPNSGVIVLAATNRGEILDKAILRPGRFDRHIYLDLPNGKERKAILEVHTLGIKTDKSINPEILAQQTPGFSGADLANLCNEAALLAARRKKSQVSQEEFSDALDRIVGGLENKNKVISAKERNIVAYHEAGHALATCYLKGLKGVVKVTIIPRGKSLGATWNRPEELQLLSMNQLKNEIRILLAGRAAEDVIFDEVSSGALDDLERVSKQAYGMIAYYGLSPKVGNISYYSSNGENSFQKPYSEETGRLIDEEVRELVSNCYEDVKNLFIEHKEELEKIGQLLLEKEVIYRDDLKTILKMESV